jgi:hypothetical protein
MGTLWQDAFPYVAALLPTAGTVFLFYFVMKYIFEGDRRERIAQAQWEAAHGGPRRTVSPVNVPAESADLSEVSDDPGADAGESAGDSPA